MIRRQNELYILETKDTTYCFRVMSSGHLEHLYYGKKINLQGGYKPLIEDIKYIGGSQLAYSKNHPELSLENLCLEMSSLGKGDIREPFLEITHEDGSITNDFLFKNAKILDHKEMLKNLPSAYIDESKHVANKINEVDNNLTYNNLSYNNTTNNNTVNNNTVNNNTANNNTANNNTAKNTPISNIENINTINNNTANNNKAVSLEIELYDANYKITLTLIYSVFYESNVITRSAKIKNTSHQSIYINRIMSGQLDLDTSDFIISTFHGTWAREMKRYDTSVQPGIIINDSKTGTSSNRSNPFFMVSERETNEDHGNCYGFNLIYSGNHYAAVEVNCMGKLRVLNGIQPNSFQYLLKPNDTLEAPESVMTYSNKGFTGMSHNMHQFIRNHIVRGEWKDKIRPILLNSWEANYFKFNENKLLKQAKIAKEVGIELFVLDDGWFGNRNDDTCSLGDWQENREKLKSGLKGLSKKINALGMDFGIWVEPEMVNEDSNCFRLHPDWAVQIQGTEHSIGRNQMILDLTREEVRKYIITEMSKVFSSANISYVKWDMNRIFSDHYSIALDVNRQKEFNYRYMMGLYQVLGTLTKRFPHILFEGCASGGNRFDLGMLCYMPQIWASDNTDAICRADIQNGYSYGYPMSVISAHVSNCPNHQTLRNTSIDTRFEVAAFGLLGYECNLAELSTEEKKTVIEQIAFYKKHRKTLQYGDFYRIKNDRNNIYQWLVVDPDKSKALGLYLQKEVIPNFSFGKFITKGLLEDKKYHFTNRQRIFNIKEFGDLINMISPIHIKKDSFTYNLFASIKKMPGEVEDLIAYGDVFNNVGVKLKQGFAGTGYNKDIRLFQDYASRIYVWEEIDDSIKID